MRYKEYTAPKYWSVLLVVLFLLIVIPFSWLSELNSDEALNAIIAQEMIDSGNYLNPTVFGEPTFKSMLSPWILTFIGKSIH